MAISYLEIGKIATRRNWISEKLPSYFPIGRVSKLSQVGDFRNAAAYQLFHAIELFLKYAILSKGGRCWGHDVGVLYQNYKILYPAPEFDFEHPFDFSKYEASFENIEEEEMVAKHMSIYKVDIMDQHLRYPIDSKTGGYSFDLSSCYFQEIEKTFLNMYAKINNPTLG